MIQQIPGYLADHRTAGVAALVAVPLLMAAAWLLRRKGRAKLGRRVTAAATVLGLGWSAQGMWDTAVHRYHQDVVVASVLFIIFEATLAARMLKAHQYRDDLARRPKHVHAVWVVASVMAIVVAAGEGWTQAPARLAIPLLVAYGWYVDLTADDDPGAKLRTSLRWTPRRLALWIGMIEPRKQDAETINVDRLRNRMTRLAFRENHGADWLNDILHRGTRLQHLLTLATDADVAEVRARLKRSQVDLMVEPEVAIQRALAPRSRPIKTAEPERMPQGVHMREGRILRGGELETDAVLLMQRRLATGQPVTTQQLAAEYTPPLGERNAQRFAAAGRRAARPINGHTLTAS